MLTFSRNIKKKVELIRLAESLGQNHGILTIANLQKTSDPISPEKKNKLEKVMSGNLMQHGLEAFCEVYSVRDIPSGIVEISKGHGLGDLKTNTIVFGWSEDTQGQISQLSIIRKLAKTGKNILVAHFNENLPEEAKQIDIWWAGQQNNGDLMLLLAYLLKLNPNWSKSGIRILSLVSDKNSKNKLEQGINALLPKARIQATVEVFVSDKSFKAVLEEQSKDSDIVFLGLPHVKKGEEEQAVHNLELLSANLKTTLFVQNNGMSDSIPILLKV